MILPFPSHQRRPAARAAFTLPAALALLAACAEAPQQTRSEQAQYDACHRQADQIVARANVNVLNQQDPISSPYAATSILTSSTTDLSVEHQREQVMNSCLHHLDSGAPNAGDVTATPAASAVAAPAPAPPPNLAGPSGSDLARPPILPPAQP